MKHALPAILLALTAIGAHAQTQAPGLWEHSFTMKSPGGEMERAQAEMHKQLAAMPPAERKKIEDMMASRGVKTGAQGTTAKFCLTKEQAAKPAEPHMSGDCAQSDVKRSGNTVSYKFACTKPHPVSGEGQVSYLGDKAYTGRSSLTTQAKGVPQQMTMEMSGKWLAADCGDVKPLGASTAR
ncbi:MAG TPA: DUF3617 domain-containing protein [Burkholderiaceae bacterium]|nr:DUF3617 domain-containing protein [Burkholderiaceae bacterium]